MKEFLQSIDKKTLLIAAAVAAVLCWLLVFGGLEKVKAFVASLGTNNGNSNSNGTQVTNYITNNNTSTSTATATSQVAQGFPLQKGVGTTSKPVEEVRTLQQMANYYLKNDIAVDGAWGPKTEEAMNKLTASVRRATKIPTQASAHQFKNYIDTTSGHPVVANEDMYKRMAVNSDSIWAQDKAAGTNRDIA